MNSELLNQLIDRAVAVLNQHIVPGGISDRDALSELYGIFDGPEYRAAIAAPPAPDAIVVHSMQLDDMTAQRDRFKYALELSCVANWQIAEDRLDAQRYRDTRTIYCRSNGVPESDSDDQADQYIEAHRDLLATGGQP
jgi:hypothetical protein